MSESDLVAQILNEFGSRPGIRLWRANVLVAKDRNGRVVRAGITGQADISGLLAPSGRRVEIECKTKTGRQRKEQARWQAMIEKHGGLYVLARSTEDVARALGLRLIRPASTPSPSPSPEASATPSCPSTANSPPLTDGARWGP